MLGFFLVIFPKLDATSGGGCDDNALLALNSLTSDMSNGCVGSCMFGNDEFVDNISGCVGNADVDKFGD